MPTRRNNKEEDKDPFLLPFTNSRPNPDYTSFVTRNAALIAARTTNSQLQTVGDGESKDLISGQDKDLLAILGPDYSDQFRSSYDTIDLIRFHECLRDDGIAAASIDFLIQFMLGDHFKTIIDVNSEFDTEEEASAALEFFTNNPQIRAYKRKLDQINRELKFQIHMFSLLIQCMAFGRACGLIERSDLDNLPIAIKIMPSMHLGQVYVHRKTWEVMAVEHLDFKFPASIIKIEDMIYFANRNHNISPGTFQYGYSLLERVTDLSELNRITNQRNLKEINYRLWAAFLLVKLPGSYNQTIMNKLVEDLAKGAGNNIVTNQAATVEVHQVGHDMDKLLDQRDKNYREIIRQLQVPIILFDPDILNRATSQELMEAWTVSVLKIYRSWLKDIIQDQWINPIVKTLIENERTAIREGEAENTSGPFNRPLETPKEDVPPKEDVSSPENPGETIVTPSVTREVIPIEAIDPATGEVVVYRLPWKIKIEFEPLNYDTFKEKAETAILLKNNGLATTATALKMIGVTDENEIAQLLELEEQRRQERFAMAGAEQISEAGDEANPNKTTDPEEAKRLAKEQRDEKARLAGAPRGRQPSTFDKQKDRFKQDIRKSITSQNTPSKGAIRPRRTSQ